jgi:hypothetical protein
VSFSLDELNRAILEQLDYMKGCQGKSRIQPWPALGGAKLGVGWCDLAGITVEIDGSKWT